MKTVLDATQGNLSIHLKKLAEAAYVAIDKSFVSEGRLPGSASPAPAGCTGHDRTPLFVVERCHLRDPRVQTLPNQIIESQVD